jgi:hypothetical protein
MKNRPRPHAPHRYGCLRAREAFSLGSMGRTDIKLVNENNAWKIKKEGAWTSIP